MQDYIFRLVKSGHVPRRYPIKYISVLTAVKYI